MLVALCLAAVPARAEERPTTFPELRVKGIAYHDVRVLSVTVSTLTVKHRDGLAQIPLRDLPPELQERFGFDADAAKANEARLNAEATARLEAQRKQQADEARARPAAPRDVSPVERALRRFGTPATWPGADLRPKYREWEINTKDQGYRPSCSIFAIVNALEYENAVANGRAEKLSEEYLIWATRRSLGFTTESRDVASVTGFDDAGFALGEVVGALRTYGISLQSEMPNMRGLPMSRIAAPSEEVIRNARERRQVFTHLVPGRDNATKIENIVHVLNEGIPVVIGMRWPVMRTLKGALISTQAPIPGYSHAVTLIGYYNESRVRDETRFIFRNSWGMSWGAGGCGFVELRYLREHLIDSVVLEVRPAAAR